MNLYEVYDGDEFIGEYTARQIEEELGGRKNYIASYASAGTKIAGRYRVHKTEDRTLSRRDKPLLIEFEKAAAKILRLAGGMKQ